MLDCDLKSKDKYKNYIIQSNTDNAFLLQNHTSTWKVVFAMNCFTDNFRDHGHSNGHRVQFSSGVQSMSTREYLCERCSFGPKLCDIVIIIA